MRVQKRKERI